MLEHQRLSLKNTISRLINECKNTKELKLLHTQLIKSRILSKPDQDFLFSRLLFFTALSGSGYLNYATHIFNHHIKNPNLHAYNIMIRAFASKFDESGSGFSQSFDLYKQMLVNGVSPDCLTLTFLFKECKERVSFEMGRAVHGQAVKFGVLNDVYVGNSLITLYSSFGFVSCARKLFDGMMIWDVVSWNAMIIGYSRSGELDEALRLFRMMIGKNIITWNSMITGFVQGGRPKEALELFREMQRLSDEIHGVRPDKVTIASVISACAYLGSIDLGKWIHGYLRRSGLESDVAIGTALVDMYGKCGYLEKAYEVFTGMDRKDTMMWTTMISSFASYGYGKEAFDVFEDMVAQGVKPNHITFIGLLSACAHSGLVEKACWYFDAMRRVYSIEPQVHHYACMAGVFGRSGLFKEAEKLIGSMPMEPDVFVWGALLGGCQMHGNVELGERVAQHLIDLDPTNHAFYMNLCDIYAKANRFNDVKRIRFLMQERRVKKDVPGCSIIEVNGVVHEFSVIGSPYVMMNDIVLVLIALKDLMKIEATVPLIYQS